MENNNEVTPSLSRVLGITFTLPGESIERYQASLEALIKELGATTVLQVYLAEKIHECLWWIHRYEAQKRATVIVEMAEHAVDTYSSRRTLSKTEVRNALLENSTVDDKITESINTTGHTLESIRQKAMDKQHENLVQLDQQIALQTKILFGLQRSYEVAFNRKMNVERLQLQNDLLRRDVQGIDVDVVEESRE